MKVEITDCRTGKVLFTHEAASGLNASTAVGVTVLAAVGSGANLSGANLSGANLSGANLSGANLSGAKLSGSKLRDTVLRGANLSGANLSGANLRCADLHNADLRGADLRGANLRGANLRAANLCDANLEEASGLAFQIPQEGELIVWKAVVGGVCKLRIPPEAARTATPMGRRCRAEWVEVLEAPEDGRGIHNPQVIYRAGEIVRPDRYDPDFRTDETNGVHFYLSREEAETHRRLILARRLSRGVNGGMNALDQMSINSFGAGA